MAAAEAAFSQYHDVLPILSKIKNNYNELMRHTYTQTASSTEKGWLVSSLCDEILYVIFEESS